MEVTRTTGLEVWHTAACAGRRDVGDRQLHRQRRRLAEPARSWCAGTLVLQQRHRLFVKRHITCLPISDPLVFLSTVKASVREHTAKHTLQQRHSTLQAEPLVGPARPADRSRKNLGEPWTALRRPRRRIALTRDDDNAVDAGNDESGPRCRLHLGRKWS